eukprot:7290599-Prorocentrum_lima.AAC.1
MMLRTGRTPSTQRPYLHAVSSVKINPQALRKEICYLVISRYVAHGYCAIVDEVLHEAVSEPNVLALWQ